MKGQLEQLNEPVDDLMEVSKVQTQILNLTGNQVDIFDSTTQEFRSTYDILKDISEVWDNLSSVNRASLTEILFGKNRANVGLAIIQAFQSGQIESALESSLDSAGTAVEENERLMQGLQASLNALKGAFQDLSNAVMSSGFLKGIIGGATDFLKVLTLIVDKVGTLPTLLAAIGAYSGFKGVNIGANLMSMFGIGVGGGSSNQVLAAIREYNAAMQQTNTVAGYQAVIQRTVNSELASGNAVFKNYITGLNGAKASMAGYTSQLVAAKASTVALQIGTVALNAVLTMGIGLAISAAVSGIMKLVTAEKEAAEKEKELREEYARTAEERKREVKSLNDSLTNYTEIATTVKDVADQEKRLSDLQDGLVDKFGEKAKAIGEVNDKYSETIEKIQQLKLEEAKEYIEKADRTDSYKKAQEDLLGGAVDKYNPEANFRNRNEGITRILTSHWFAGLSDDFEEELNKLDNVVAGKFDDFYVGGTLEQQRETLKQIVDIYKQTDGWQEKTVQRLNDQIDALDKQIKQDKAIVAEYEAAQKVISELELPEETKNQFDFLIDKAKELNDVATGDGTDVQKMEAVQGIKQVEDELYKLADNNQEMRNVIKTVFSEFVTGSKTGVQAIENLTEAWFNRLDDLQKNEIKNIDSIKSALQTIAGGGKLSDKDFWELAKLDTDHILDGAQVIEGQFVLSAEQLVKLKDTYIQKQIESVKLDMEQAELGKKNAEQQARILESQINNWNFAQRNLNNPTYRAEYNRLEANLKTAKDNAKQYGETWRFNNTLLMYYNSNLGDTVDRQKQLTDLTKNLQSEADNLLKAQEYRIDQIIDKYENEKEAIEDAKKVLEDQLAVLEEQEDALKNTIENYKTVAETVQSAIQEQIDKIKEENEERENALDLATKLANLENARNKKVRIYTEAGGWQYEAKKSDVEKAERELEKTKEDERIKLLEAQLKKWQNITDKRQKAEDERLAEEILGADWRLKISEQDEEIFNKYEKEYDAYGNQLWQISNVEIATVKKSIEAKDREIAAKEAQIKEWQKYKSAVQKAANDAKAANEEYMKYLSTVQVDENSSLEARERNLQNFATQYAGIMDQISQYSQQIGSLDSSINIDTTNIEKAATEMGDFIEKYRDGVLAMSEALDASSTGYGIVNSEWDAKLVKAAKELRALRGYANGGVADRTGLAMLHGTKQRSETIFNANDSAKLYDLVHSTPNLVATALTDGANIARSLGNKSANDSRSVTLNGTTINLPNVQNAEQFARQFESYMKTVLAESQIYKPSR